MRYTRSAAIRGLLVAGSFLVATAVFTGFVPSSLFDRYVPRSGFDVLFLLSTTVLLGTYTTQRCTRTDCSRSPSAYLGGLGGYFAVSCPYCLPGIAGAVSASTITTYLVPVRPVVGVVSVGLLAGVIAVRQRRLVTEGPATSDVELRCPTCGASLKRTEEDPEPDFTDGLMRIDVSCPGCEDSLAVTVEASLDDRLDITKRVERKNGVNDRGEESARCQLAPNDSRRSTDLGSTPERSE